MNIPMIILLGLILKQVVETKLEKNLCTSPNENEN